MSSFKIIPAERSDQRVLKNLGVIVEGPNAASEIPKPVMDTLRIIATRTEDWHQPQTFRLALPQAPVSARIIHLDDTKGCCEALYSIAAERLRNKPADAQNVLQQLKKIHSSMEAASYGQIYTAVSRDVALQWATLSGLPRTKPDWNTSYAKCEEAISFALNSPWPGVA